MALTPQAIWQLPEYAELVRRRRRTSWSLTAAGIGVYAGYFILIAWAPDFLGHKIAIFGSVGLLAYLLLSVFAFGLVTFYLKKSQTDILPFQTDLARAVRKAGNESDVTR